MLNGDWKYTKSDKKSHSRPEYDDSGWEDVKIPVDPKGNQKGTGAGWYRINFNAPRNSEYDWLRFEQILDEGQVWLNGVQLINPKFQPPLEDRQYGVYANVWPFQWPETFQAGNLIKHGAKNVIAVRVTDYPARGTPEISIHEEPSFRGVAGITGNVSLIGHSNIFVRAFQRVAPKKLFGKNQCSHIFRAVIGNSSMGKRKCTVKMSIHKESGALMFEKSNSVLVDSSGGVTEFSWTTKPRFESYRAVLHITADNGGQDEVSLTFNGVFIQASGGELLVNGEPYRIKGVKGLPGVLAGANGKTTLKNIWASDELARLANLGVNTLRAENPPPSIIRAAAEAGIMVVPVISSHAARTTLALREHDNILYWDITSANRQEIPGMLKAVESLDPYRRPISYSGPLNLNTSAREHGSVKIRGYRMTQKDMKTCGIQEAENSAGLTAVIVDWDAETESGDGFEAIHAAPELQQSWSSCVKTNKTRGAFLSSLPTTDNGAPTALRARESFKWKPYIPEILSGLYRDFDIRFPRDSSGGPAADIIYSGVAIAENTGVRTSPGRPPLVKRDTLARGQSIRAELPRSTKDIPNLTLEFTTNGGIPHRYTFDFSAPVYDPAAGYISVKPLPLIQNREAQANVVLKGNGASRSAEISVSSSNPAITIKPAKRGVSIPADDDVSAPFSVIPKKNRTSALITATVKYTDTPGPPINIYLIVNVN